MIEDKVKELLNSMKSIASNACCDRCRESALVAKAAITAFESPEPKRGELWVNEHRDGDVFCYTGEDVARSNCAKSFADRTAVHYREVLPGDENLVLVKPGKDWSDEDLGHLHEKYIDGTRSVIDAIKTKLESQIKGE